jgi:hypothetical protein
MGGLTCSVQRYAWHRVSLRGAAVDVDGFQDGEFGLGRRRGLGKGGVGYIVSDNVEYLYHKRFPLYTVLTYSSARATLLRDVV